MRLRRLHKGEEIAPHIFNAARIHNFFKTVYKSMEDSISLTLFVGMQSTYLCRKGGTSDRYPLIKLPPF